MEFQIFQLNHRNLQCTGIKIDRNDGRNEAVRKIPGIRWSKTHSCWYAAESRELTAALSRIFPDWSGISESMGQEVTNFPDPIIREALDQMLAYMEVTRYSENTIHNYMNAILDFLRYFRNENWKSPETLDFIRFQKERIIDRQLSVSWQNIVINAIKVFYKSVLKITVAPDFIKRPKGGKRIPEVLGQEDMKQLFMSVKNFKHRAMLILIFGCGLRSGELIKLLPGDIDSKRELLYIRAGKGNKDRHVPISKQIIKILREYYKIYKPKYWLFEGAKAGQPYSQRSLQQVMKRAVKESGLQRMLRLHDLRHSFATHHVEFGTNLRLIQEMLGHKSSRTTEIYTHVSKAMLNKLRNPFDDLNL